MYIHTHTFAHVTHGLICAMNNSARRLHAQVFMHNLLNHFLSLDFNISKTKQSKKDASLSSHLRYTKRKSMGALA